MKEKLSPGFHFQQQELPRTIPGKGRAMKLQGHKWQDKVYRQLILYQLHICSPKYASEMIS